ncbi:MAG: efflux RND transporter periplasmic adaptor subunit [Desulfovibrio sp.]|jgi:Cu(I)/Ag(I) efflux system membrane fusion protein|nr:efflux RND transporter periplasmic adaptor subunit [Desulfovibrio sp.]
MTMRRIATFCLLLSLLPGLAPAAEEEQGKPKVLYWYDPMYPATHFDKPGKSPFMDMELVPRYATDDEGGGIRIDPAQVQNLAVRTKAVEWGRLPFARDLPANVEFNSYQLAKVQPRADGFVSGIYSLAVGDRVAKGAPLVDVTVPGWASDQSEYLLLKSQKADPGIVRGVRERLRISGMPEEMLQAVDSTGRVQTRMIVRSPVAGVVTSFDVYPGMNVTKTMTLAVVQGTDPVWVTADVPERDLPLVAKAGRLRVRVQAWPDRSFTAESYTLLPNADQNTRTVPLRMVLPNREGLLTPGMTASLRLRGTGDEAFLIPTQALIDLGDEKRVVVRLPDGRFMPKAVTAIGSSGDVTAVSEGLETGDQVVVGGLFLIDSESNLRGALDRMREDAARKAEGSP